MTAQLVVFRVDASLRMGSGHVMRCLTLADALAQAGFTCTFISRDCPGHLHGYIQERGFAVQVPIASAALESMTCDRVAHADWLECGWEMDAWQTRDLIAGRRPDWLVVDHYSLDERWEQLLRPVVRRLLVIDDLADRAHQCDLLLDQNLGRQPQDYAPRVPATCELLTGSAYALLRPQFPALRAYSLQRRNASPIRDILIAMGGADADNATGQILAALANCDLPQQCKVTVVMGSQAPRIQQVQAAATTLPCATQVRIDISDMAQCMADSDLAIGAAGSTAWERCCLGLPTWMLVLADNQRGAALQLESAGAARTFDFGPALTTQLRGALDQLVRANGAAQLRDMGLRASALVDGIGTQRVVARLLAMNNEVDPEYA